MELANTPDPEPSVVWLSEIVGLPEVFQHTPRAITVELPPEVTLPPEEADVVVIALGVVVVTVGNVENVSSLP